MHINKDNLHLALSYTGSPLYTLWFVVCHLASADDSKHGISISTSYLQTFFLARFNFV